MGAIMIVLVVSAPVIVIGTALHLWRQRAATTWQRRRRGLFVLLTVLLALLATRIWMWAESGQSRRELWGILFVFALCLTYPAVDLLSHSARRKED